MRTLAPLVLAMGLAGCAHTSEMASSGADTVIVGTAVGLSVSATYAGQSSPISWALLALYLAGASQVEGVAPPPPPMDPGRTVNEVDCTRPIADWSANLRCK